MKQAVCVVAAILVVVSAVRWAPAQCVGLWYEQDTPPAVRGMNADDPSLLARYWEWGDWFGRRGGDHRPTLANADDGVLVTDLDWSDADVCARPGEVERTVVLLEALGPDGFGRWALVNLAAVAGGGCALDEVQLELGDVLSEARAIPSPVVESVEVVDGALRVELGWQLELEPEALSDLAGEAAEPLPSVRGVGVYVVNGPRATPRPWDWSLARDRETDAVGGFSTDDHATVTLPLGMWAGQSVCFALALAFDGSGDGRAEAPEKASVHGEYLGRPSRWVVVPFEGATQAIGIANVELGWVHPRLLTIAFDASGEPSGASYRVWARPEGGRPQLLARIVGGEETYQLQTALPPWCAGGGWDLVIEMLDTRGRVVDTRSVPTEG